MARSEGAEIVQYGFDGGYVRGPRGLLEFLFGELEFRWESATADGRGKRPYGSRQRSNAAAGQVMKLKLATGEVYSVRTTSTQKSFIRELISNSQFKISEVWSERGTAYGRKKAEEQ